MKIGYQLQFECLSEFPGSVHAALRDLRRDLRLSVEMACEAEKAVFGIDPKLGAEGFAVRVKDGILQAEGGDALGLIYAIYTLSEELLDISPLWYWLDIPCKRRSHVEVAEDWGIASSGPAFKYRGWFMNDEDLLSHWAADPHSGISYEAYQMVFEALLRSRGNMIVPGTSIFADELSWKWAAERGLMLAEHHMDNLGLNPFRWPSDVPYNYLTHPEVLEHFWRVATRAKAAHGTKVIWSVGHRGKADRPFWHEIPELKSRPDLQGKVIGEIIKRQIEIIHEVDPDPECVLHTWMEISELLEKGFLVLPDNVRLVWADFHGGTATVIEPGKPGVGDGVYYHLAMHGQEKGHLVAWAPLSRIRDEFQRYQEIGATHYLLINVSNLRPFSISASISTRWLYDGIDSNDPYKAVKSFFAESIGLPVEKAIDWYESFTLASAAFGRMPGCLVGDEGPMTLTLQVLDSILMPESLNLEQVVDGLRGSVFTPKCNEANRYIDQQDLLEAVIATVENYKLVRRKANELVSGEESRFQDAVNYLVRFQSNYLLTLWQLTQAVLEAKILQEKREKSQVILALEKALVLADAQYEMLQEVSRGKWLGFYDCGIISPIRVPSKRIRWALDVLRGHSEVPDGRKPWQQAYDIFHEIKSYHGDKREVAVVLNSQD